MDFFHHLLILTSCQPDAVYSLLIIVIHYLKALSNINKVIYQLNVFSMPFFCCCFVSMLHGTFSRVDIFNTIHMTNCLEYYKKNNYTSTIRWMSIRKCLKDHFMTCLIFGWPCPWLSPSFREWPKYIWYNKKVKNIYFRDQVTYN